MKCELCGCISNELLMFNDMLICPKCWEKEMEGIRI